MIQLGRGRAPCRPGKQFGSRCPGNPADTVVYDFLPDEQLRQVPNLADFYGILVFDKCTCNTNGRQTIFYRDARARGAVSDPACYSAEMIDNGFCFNAGEWNFPDAPLRGLYARHRVFSAQKAVLAESFDSELDRLYHDHVAPPSRRPGGIIESTRDWMREKLNDVFRRHRILGKLEHRVRVEGFTQPGDPMRLDYGYQNGVRGFIHSVSLRRDLPQVKALAYTAECIHARDALAKITAIAEAEPDRENPRQLFVERLFTEKRIRIVPMSQLEGFAEELRLRIQ